MDKIIRQIPNLFTLANLFIGCMAIVYLFYDHLYIYVGGKVAVADQPQVAVAAVLVIAAALLDFVDGFLARLLRAQSPMGKQLDSLADLVTFGVVPGLMLYQLTAQAYYLRYDSFSIPILLFASGFLVTLGAAWRLARFNLADAPGPGFSGLPTPAMAMFTASLPVIALSNPMGVGEWLQHKWLVIGVSVGLTILMTSRIPLLSLKVSTFSFKKYPWQIGGSLSGWVLFFSCIFVFRLGWLTIPVCFAYYLLLSALHHFSSRPQSLST